MRILAPLTIFAAIVAALLMSSGCNIYDFLDTPSGDVQLLSAARACFDRGDIECAKENYNKLSSAYDDTKKSETAFMALDAQGATMGAFMEFIGNVTDKSTGYALTKFAEQLYSQKGLTQRVTIWNAYNTDLPSDTNLKNFVTFVGSLSMAASILAEAADTDGIVHQSGIVKTPSGCTTSCGLNTACDPPLVSGISNSAGDLNSAPTNTTPSMDQFNAAINTAITALNALGAGGKFGNALGAFNTIYNSTPPSTAGAIAQCYRMSLLSENIGE